MTTDTTSTPDLTAYDVILLNSSGGKDSQAMLDYVTGLATAQGVADRIVVVHADLGRVEWAGTLELAAEQAAFYGHRFEVVKRDVHGGRDLLEEVLARRIKLDADADAFEAAGDLDKAKAKREANAWPSSDARWCTSYYKRDQVQKLYTALTDELAHLGRQVRILDCQGIRADEGWERAQKNPFQVSEKRSNGKREVTEWFPIFTWTEAQVWERIATAGTRSHSAYAAGMRRLSCVFCVFATNEDLRTAGRLNPELADEYMAMEDLTGNTFKSKKVKGQLVKISLRSILADAA